MASTTKPIIPHITNITIIMFVNIRSKNSPLRISRLYYHKYNYIFPAIQLPSKPFPPLHYNSNSTYHFPTNPISSLFFFPFFSFFLWRTQPIGYPSRQAFSYPFLFLLLPHQMSVEQYHVPPPLPIDSHFFW